MIEINGEFVEESEAASLLRMFYNDAKQIAGVFHGQNRSVKFRLNWPDEYAFADANWKTFVGACRQMYTEQLADPKTPPAKARMLHLALVLDAKIGKDAEKDTRLQLAPGTQQFEGDKAENRKIVEKFGKRRNLRAAMLNYARVPLKMLH